MYAHLFVFMFDVSFMYVCMYVYMYDRCICVTSKEPSLRSMVLKIKTF